MLAIPLFTIFNGCKKASPVIEPSSINTTPQFSNITQSHGGVRDESDVRLYATLNSIALGLLNPAQNVSFRTFVHNKASEQFDEDDNVLLKTIQEAGSETNLDLITEIIGGIDRYQGQVINNTLDYGITNNETNISSGVLSYPYNNDNTFYFQIYVPYINQVDLNSMPVIAPEMDEDNDCKIWGYQHAV